jgi:hypothetical protein
VNDMQIVRDFCAEEEPPGPQRLAAMRAQVVAGFGGAPPGRARRRIPAPRALPRPILAHPRLTLAGVVAAAAALIAALVVPSGAGGRAAPGGTGRVRLDAVVVLHRAAQAALTAPGPGSNRYVYVAGVGELTHVGGHRVMGQIQEWSGIRSGKQNYFCEEVSHSHAPKGVEMSGPCSQLNMPTPALFTYAGAQALPTQPGALLRYLDGEIAKVCGGLSGLTTAADREWAGVVTMLNYVPLLPPRLGAALMEAAARIPGITVIRHATTVAGQPGIGLARALQNPGRSPLRWEVIVSPSTYRFIGANVTYGPPGDDVSTALLKTGFTSATPKPSVFGTMTWTPQSCEYGGLAANIY